MTKKGIIFSIVGLVIVFIILAGILLFGLFGNLKINFFHSEYKTVVFDKSYENIDAITVDSTYGNVYLEYADDDKIRVEIASKKEYVKVKNEDNKLVIDVNGPKCKLFCIGQKQSRITIYLPKNYDKKVSAKLKMGDLKVQDFKKLKMDVQNDMGDIKITGVSSLTGKVKMGDFKIKNIYNYVNIKNNMGDIKIENLNITKDSNIKNNMGDVKINKTNNIYVDTHVDMGDVKVKKNNRKSDIVLKINSNMGDIKVNY